MTIRLLVLDVDGTLTDNSVNISDNGELFKRFDMKDGHGIKMIKGDYGVVPVVITGRTSKSTEHMCTEFKIDELYQGISNKKECLLNIIKKYNLTLGEVAYVGDDIIDLECMSLVGLPMCPHDAIIEVINVSKYVSSKSGGQGAVRDCIEFIIKMDLVDKVGL